MSVINEAEKIQLRNRLESELLNPVDVIHFTIHQYTLYASGDEYSYALEARAIAEDIASLSGMLKLTTYDFAKDKELVQKYGIERAPCTILEAAGNRRIRHFGTLGGYHFGNLIQAIIDVSKDTGRVSSATKNAFKGVDTNLEILVLSDSM